jgi:ABC-2 type transport system ATP-binding protein
MPLLQLQNITLSYSAAPLLKGADLQIDAGERICLVGRNGAGKTTLMRIIAGQEFASAGSVRVFGVSPVENDRVLRRMVFVREDQSYPDISVGDTMRAASWFYPHWSRALADSLVSDFELPRDRPVKKLSRGMRSALGIVLGLAARAEVTMFDEPYTGLDAVARQVFSDRLLADYTDRPRTVLLSTHDINEVAGLLERVVVMDRGQVALDAPADDLRGAATRVSGPVLAVEEFTAGYPVWDRRRMGSQESVVIVGSLGEAERAPARTARLTLEPLSLQELVVHAAGRPVPDAELRTNA